MTGLADGAVRRAAALDAGSARAIRIAIARSAIASQRLARSRSAHHLAGISRPADRSDGVGRSEVAPRAGYERGPASVEVTAPRGAIRRSATALAIFSGAADADELGTVPCVALLIVLARIAFLAVFAGQTALPRAELGGHAIAVGETGVPDRRGTIGQRFGCGRFDGRRAGAAGRDGEKKRGDAMRVHGIPRLIVSLTRVRPTCCGARRKLRLQHPCRGIFLRCSACRTRTHRCDRIRCRVEMDPRNSPSATHRGLADGRCR